MKPPEIFETQRLRLRPPVMEDAEEIFLRYAQDAEVTKYLTWRAHKSVETVREFLGFCLRELKAGRWVQWVIAKKDDRQLIGMIGLKVDGHKAELGYVLARAYWNTGYMTEAARAVVKWALEQKGIYRVWAVCDVENQPSARVMEKIGMQREGVLRRWIMHPNRSDEPRDCYCYALTK
jgi:RimJ/RimL family protein N-acetyltransferase